MDSYWGGAGAAAAGAMVFGAYARIVRRTQPMYAWVLRLGVVVLANTRPYEGFLFAAPVLIALMFRERSVKVWAPIGLMLALGAVGILGYNYRA